MQKNVKTLFFVLMLVSLLVSIAAISAASDDNGVTADTEASVDVVENDVTAADDNNVANTKTIEKEDKNLKTATRTVEVNNYAELTTAMNDAVKDSENDTYIINLNEGTYQITGNVNYAVGSYTPTIIINANNQTLSGDRASRRITLSNNCNVTINNAIITHMLYAGSSGYDFSLGSIVYNKTNLTLNDVSINNSMRIYDGSSIEFKNSTISASISNNGKVIIDDDVIVNTGFSISGTGELVINNLNIIYPYMSTFTGGTLTGIIIDKDITNNGELTLNDVTINKTITNNGKLIISDDTTFTENCIITGGDIEINNTDRVAPYLINYNGNYTITNNIIVVNKNNNGNLTLINSTVESELTNNGALNLTNSTINSTITNTGVIYIDEDTVFAENGKIIGLGETVTDNINRILPYIETITGNYTISDTTLDKTYKFLGNITITNCNITSTDNVNFKILNISNCNITVPEENIFIKNYDLLILSNTTDINDKIENHKDMFYNETPESYVYDENYHIITKDTINIYFDSTKENKLSNIVKEGDTLDFQGEIKLNNKSLIINKPVNIITTTNDTYVDLNTTAGSLSGENPGSSFVINYDGSNTNVTGIYFHNTQLWLYNTHNVTLDNISGVVESQRVGSGVGQTSIRANSTNITVKNSYFYTKDNGGSSTLVFAWADNSTIENCTVVGVGNVGNLIYLTTYNVEIGGTTPNSNNKILNNTIIGPERATGICWGIVLSGTNNIVDGNTIYYTGTGITGQWGSGVSGDYNDEQSLIDIYNNTVSNNKLYNGSSILQGNIIYNNYLEGGGLQASNARVYNNTINGLTIGSGEIIVNNNTILGTTTVQSGVNRTYALIENNTLNAISIKSNNTLFKNNNITSITNEMVTSNSTFINNNITGKITFTYRSLDFTFTDNNITGNINIECNKSIWTNNEITGNINIGLMDGNDNQFTSNNITGNIYINSSWYATGNTITDNNIQGYIHIITIEGANNTLIQNNTIITDKPYTITQTKPTAWSLDVNNYTIIDNYLKADGTYGDNSVNLTRENNIIENNTPIHEIRINPITITANTNALITANMYFDEQPDTTTNTGKVCFKINGKILRDDTTGKIIYIDVTEGTATIEYNDTTKWNEDTRIEALYMGNDEIPQLASEAVNPTITYPEQDEPEFTVSDITTKAGSEVTITVTTKNLDAGKVVLKVNGKTAKAADGKLYAKTNGDTTTFTYTVPKTYKAGEYSIKAVYTSGTTKLEAESKLTVE